MQLIKSVLILMNVISINTALSLELLIKNNVRTEDHKCMVTGVTLALQMNAMAKLNAKLKVLNLFVL